MKRRLHKTALLVLFVFMVMIAGCGENGDTEWTYQNRISQPIKVTSSDQAVTLGALDKEQVQISIPGQAFDQSTQVQLFTPQEVPKVMGKEITPLGSPIEIKTGEKPVRLNQPVTITIKMDKAAIAGKTDPGAFWATYYNGENWDYIKADKVDLENGTLQFTTYHFSLFGYGEVSVEERVKKWTNNEALAKWAQDSVKGKMDEAAEKIIDNVLSEKLGIEDESTKMKVLGSLLKDGEWGDIRKNLQGASADGLSPDQMAEFTQKVTQLAGKKIVDVVPKSKLASALGGITSDFGLGTATAASQAAGALAAGNKTEAARILGEHLADQFVATTVIKVAVATVQNQIDSWKNAELEAAFQVYKNGASSKIPYWGYNVEKENFDDLWLQMKGASRQVEIEAIAAQEKAYREAGYPPLSNVEKDKIRAIVKRDLEKQFKQRLQDEKEIANEAEKLKELVDKYKESNLLEPGRDGYNKQYTMEQRLDILIHLKDKILKDIKRTGLTTGANTTAKNLSYADLTQLTRAWYLEPDGPAQYAQMVKDKFGIDLFPPATELNGVWQGTFTITSVNVPQGSKTPEGCDVQSMVGKPRATQYTVNLNNAGTGTLSILGSGGSQPAVIPITYASGRLSGSLSKEGGTMSIKGTANQGVNEMSIGGAGSASGSGLSLKFNWSAKKALPAPATKSTPAKK